MTVHRILSTPRALLAAGLFFGVAAAQAATGFTVNPKQEALVTPGMSAAEVRMALGSPEQRIQYGNEPGPTFTYRVAAWPETLFDVDFGANGRVASVSERADDRGGDN